MNDIKEKGKIKKADLNKNEIDIIEISFKFCKEIEDIILGNDKKAVNNE